MDYSKSAVLEEIEFSEANNVLLMSLMEETQEDEFYGNDRLVSIIQSLEQEITDPKLDRSAQVDGHNCSGSISDDFSWIDMEVASSSPFHEMNAWSPCGDEMDGMVLEYGVGNGISDYSQIYCGVFLEQQQMENYLLQDQNDIVF